MATDPIAEAIIEHERVHHGIEPEPEPEPTVLTWHLINPSTDQRVGTIAHEDQLTPPFAVEIAGTGVESVQCYVDGTLVKTESNAPFAPFGDTSGNFVAANLSAGSHILRAVAWSEKAAAGNLLADESINVFVVSTAPPPPPPPSGTGPSGIAVRPVKTGWRRVGFSHFDTDIALGSWTGDPQGALIPRPDAARDGTYRDSSGRAIYDAEKTISQEGSLLVCRMKQIGSQRYAGSPITRLDSVPSLRVTQVMKVDGPEAGWKIAPLVAVMGSNVATRGEYDMPECRLTSSPNVNAFMHKVGGAQVHFDLSDVFGPGSIYQWHEWTIEVKSGQWVDYFVDGKLLVNTNGTTQAITNPGSGQHSVADGVTKETVRWRLQHETLLAGDPIPATMGEAKVLIDWVAIDVPA